MEDTSTIAGRLRYLTKRLSNRGSYDCQFNAPCFKLKSLCSNGIIVPSLDKATSNQAVDLALTEVGSLEGRNKQDVVLKISIKDGVVVSSRKSKKDIHTYGIHEVGYCNVDKRYPQIFVFIATNDNKTLKCHVFLCEDKQKSKAICLTMAKAFENSFSNWKKSKEFNSNDNRRVSVDVLSQRPPKTKLEQRRASDFITTMSNQKRLDVRRSSADTVHHHMNASPNSSDNESMSSDKDNAYQTFLSRSVDKCNPSLLRRESTDWDAIVKDEEVARKMQGDLVLWETFDQD